MSIIPPILDPSSWGRAARPLLELVARNQNGVGLLLIGASACIEYLFPPFPGDLIVVFAAFLVARRGWSMGLVLASVLAGSALGAFAEYQLGRFLARAESRWASGWRARLRPRVDTLVARFARHGSAYLAINRFLPSVRWLFFIAAGMAGLPLGRALFFGLISALAWNGCLLLVGARLGAQWPRLVAALEAYGEAVWVALGTLALALVARWLIRRRRR
jgi:membrane-associated protein